MERQGGDHFEEFLKIIAAKQNQDDPEFDLREVSKFYFCNDFKTEFIFCSVRL